MTLQRITHTGAAPVTGVAAGFTSGAGTFTLVSGTGYPTGSGGPFVLKVDGGTASEEKILCSALSGVTVTVQTRGYDNTTAASHGTGTTNVEHCYTAAEADDTSDHVYTTTRDDHTQYARTDGSRAITGAQIFDSTVQVVGATTCDGNLTVLGSLIMGGVSANGVGGTTDATWTAVTPANSWTNVGSPYRAAGYRLVNGQVLLRGVMASGTIGSAMFTLGAGYRPSASVALNPVSPNTNHAGLLTIASSGTVTYSVGTGPLQVSLDGISFDLL